MSRAPCRIRHDEVFRSVKAVQKTGLSVCRVDFTQTADCIKWSVIIGESGEGKPEPVDLGDEAPRLIREPQL